MSGKKDPKNSPKKTSGDMNEEDELNRFIEKKKIQSEALKKIMDKLNLTKDQIKE